VATGQRFNLPYATVENNIGVPLPGAKLYFYLTGTSTPHDTWSNVGLTIANTNPVVADSSGRFPNVFLDPSIAYKVTLTDSSGVQIWTADPVQGVPPFSQQGDYEGDWFTINLLDGGLVDTSQTHSANILVHVDHALETGITYLGNCAGGTRKRIRVDAAADIFFGFDNFGAGATLFGFNEIMSTAEGGSGAAIFTITPDDIVEFVALDSVNTAGDRCWLCTNVNSRMISTILRPGGEGHITPPDLLWVFGTPKFLQTQPNIPQWPVMLDPTAINGAGRVYCGDIGLNVVGDTTRIRMTAFKADPVTGEPIVSSLWPAYIANRPGIIDQTTGKLNFPGVNMVGVPTIPDSVSSIYQGYASRIDFDVLYDPTYLSTPGAVVLSACTGTQDGATYGISPWARLWVHGPTGNVVIPGKAAFEANPTWAPTNVAGYKTPAGFVDYKTTGGWGNLSLIMTDITAGGQMGNNAVLAMRWWNAQTTGMDMGGDGTDWSLYRVADGIRSSVMTVRPSSSNNVTWTTSDHTWNHTSAASTVWPIRVVNSDNTNGTGTGVQFQAGTSTGNNSAYINAINDGTGKISLVLQTANNTSAATALTLFADKQSQFSNNIFPSTDNAFSCGTLANRWSVIYAATGAINTSDRRSKIDITESDLGLDFINALTPSRFRFIVGGKVQIGEEEVQIGETRVIDPETGQETMQPIMERRAIYQDRAGVRTHYGLIAQDVQAVLAAQNVADFGGWVLGDKNDPDSEQGLRMDEFIAPLIKAVQELSAKVTALEQQVAALTPPAP